MINYKGSGSWTVDRALSNCSNYEMVEGWYLSINPIGILGEKIMP